MGVGGTLCLSPLILLPLWVESKLDCAVPAPDVTCVWRSSCPLSPAQPHPQRPPRPASQETRIPVPLEAGGGLGSCFDQQSARGGGGGRPRGGHVSPKGCLRAACRAASRPGGARWLPPPPAALRWGSPLASPRRALLRSDASPAQGPGGDGDTRPSPPPETALGSPCRPR